MSLSTNSRVVGFKAPDEKYLAMLDAWRANKAAGVPQPQAIIDFFGESAETTNGPDAMGLEVEIPSKEWRDDGSMQEGLVVDLLTIPDGVSVLRFINSY